MRVTFRGVRGSVPWSQPDAGVHGCNTSCLEVSDEASGAILILDAGSGIAGARPELVSEPRAISLLLTHYHWDHLLGLPFFSPLYETAWPLTIHGPALASYDPGWLSTIFRAPFFPVRLEQLPNQPEVRTVSAGTLSVAGFEIAAQPLNHPGGCFAYRIKGASGDFVYATDHEFGDAAFDRPLAEFCRGAAAIALDAQFTPEEAPHYKRRGHSDWRQCAEFAAENDIRSLWLFHHKPGRSDGELAEIRAGARRVCPGADTAREGASFIL